jgi:hypothetical protein
MSHPGELNLRRHLAQEEQDLTHHLEQCAACGARLEQLRAERQSFMAEIPFERFAHAVEHKMSQQKKTKQRVRLAVVAAMAAGVLAVVAAPLVGESTNRIKGGDVVEFVVSGADGLRNASNVELLRAGERLRIGVKGHRYVLAVSIDEQKTLSTLYHQEVPTTGLTWLPDSLEFTGTGKEWVLVIVSNSPVPKEEVARQIQVQLETSIHGATLMPLDVPGVQIQRLFLKP